MTKKYDNYHHLFQRYSHCCVFILQLSHSILKYIVQSQSGNTALAT